ncbi:MAG: LysM peptidoglycan-binding domain-containing protein [Dehalococcoidia bacterium]|nr:LysM peptidoglycan-binding domain-containing protein [Dehalococcoidia bacterium]
MASLALLAAASFAIACGGSDGDGGRTQVDLGEIPTATPPEQLPEPLIVGENVAAGGGEIYVVEAGDSLAAIAEQFGTTAEAIAEANGIADPTALEVGQELVIPGSDVLGETEEPEGDEPDEAPGEGTTYVVQTGDTADGIAADFGITVEDLAAANNTTVDALRELTVGVELVIPPPSE